MEQKGMLVPLPDIGNVVGNPCAIRYTKRPVLRASRYRDNPALGQKTRIFMSNQISKKTRSNGGKPLPC